MDGSWVDRYYESLEFLFWEPQHLGRQKAVGSPIKDMKSAMAHWQSMEVTLNHIMKLFFSLAPRSIIRRVLSEGLGRDVACEYEMCSVSIEKDLPTWTHCQPDFLFITDGGVSSIEMKLDSKSSIEQVLKYALMGLAVEEEEKELSHSLVFLGKKDFGHFWPKSTQITSTACLRRELASTVEAFSDEHLKKHAHLRPRFLQVVESLEVGFLNYAEFARVLKNERERTRDSQIGDIYGGLIDGLLGELGARKLVLG